MSLEQGFSKKLTLGPPGSHQDRAISPSSTDSSPKSSPSKSAKLSLKGFGSSVRCRSPIRRQQTLAASTSVGPQHQEKFSKSCKKSSEKDKNSKDLGAACTSASVKDLGEYIPGTSGPPGVDNFPSESQSQGKQPGVANKIIHNWKSACGRTKVKTKDFLKRWKTLPENHPDFDQIPGSGDSPPGSSTNICAAVAAVSLSQPSHYAGEAGGGAGQLGTSSGLGRLKNLAKKQSEVEMPQASSGGFFGKVGGGGSTISNSNGPFPQDMDTSTQVNGTKSSTGWSVHVWATYVQRGNDEDVTLHEETKPGRDLLTEFQKIKLTHFFRHVLDMNHDDVISAEDFVALNQRIRHYIEWSSECIEFHILKEVHSGFLECFLNQPLDDSSVMYYCSSERETRQHVNIDEWLDVWGTLLASARTMEALPLWLQYFPKILFQVINKSGSPPSVFTQTFHSPSLPLHPEITCTK